MLDTLANIAIRAGEYKVAMQVCVVGEGWRVRSMIGHV
jgi:hypothetical protein